jgi:hypothetical protein
VKLYRKKRIELVVESACAKAIIDMIDAAGAKGYTVVQDVAGKGNRGVRDAMHLTGLFRNTLIIVIATEDIALRIVERSQLLLENYAGIVALSDVEVVRDEHF